MHLFGLRSAAVLLKGLVAADTPAVHDVPDKARPETWIWMLSFTWRRDSKQGDIVDSAEIRKIWNGYAEILGEPLRDAFITAPDKSTLWCDRVGQWPTVAWDNHYGRVTLAGDAAHPMTYRKIKSFIHSQGLR